VLVLRDVVGEVVNPTHFPDRAVHPKRKQIHKLWIVSLCPVRRLLLAVTHPQHSESIALRRVDHDDSGVLRAFHGRGGRRDGVVAVPRRRQRVASTAVITGLAGEVAIQLQRVWPEGMGRREDE
jgi:hypothetical protein